MILRAPDSPLEKFLVGTFLTIVGLVFIIFHRKVKKRHDAWAERVNWYGRWTGKYTRGGLIFTYAVIILIGVVFVIVGIGQLLR